MLVADRARPRPTVVVMETTMATRSTHGKNTTETSQHRPVDKEAHIRQAAREQSVSGLLVNLSTLPWRDDGSKRLRLIGCPICGRDMLEDGVDSLGGRTGLAPHLADHDPEDLGLSPTGEAVSSR